MNITLYTETQDCFTMGLKTKENRFHSIKKSYACTEASVLYRFPPYIFYQKRPKSPAAIFPVTPIVPGYWL